MIREGDGGLRLSWNYEYSIAVREGITMQHVALGGTATTGTVFRTVAKLGCVNNLSCYIYLIRLEFSILQKTHNLESMTYYHCFSARQDSSILA